QLFLWSCANPKADFGFMLLTPDLHFADSSAKRLIRSLALTSPQLIIGYLSVTELSEYTMTESEFAQTLQNQEGLQPDSQVFQQKMAEFKTRMSKYERDRLYPSLPDWPVACFYPMGKLRIPGQNWFSLPFEKRKEFMRGHGNVGRKYSGRVLQLITGSTGLDDMEWAVTLFAKSTTDIKAIVYEMRFDPASALYADFGEFFIGLSLSPHQLLARLGLDCSS
ncbi:MAG: chlorite dismutase family protein, partial [Chthoniobacterales bacterium]|nr:chlorite dismutase family protein [Chthoniobacterales bacterium]